MLARFLAACQSATLPAVSWIVAPYAYSEHPAARPVDGAAYVQRVLNAIWAQPALWAKTAIFINYDEHDGFFDHVIPPTAPYGTPEEFVHGLPVGLGPRVPMTVVSPGVAAAGSIRRYSTTPPYCASSSCGPASENRTSPGGGAVSAAT